MLIGEVAERSGVSTRMLRHYDSIGLVTPSVRTTGGYRRYSSADIHRLFHVECLRSLGLSLHQIAEALSDLEFDPSAVIDALIARTQQRIETEQRLLERLTAVRASHPDDWSDALTTVGLMRGLTAENPSQRQRHALAAGTDAGRHVGTLVEAALEETDPNAAGALYWALAQAGDGATEMLADALNSSDELRRHRAAAALEKINTPRSLAVLARAAGAGDPHVRARAVVAQGRGGDVEAIAGLVDLIVAGGDDVEAADILADLATRHEMGDDIARVLVASLPGADIDVRQRVTDTLAGIGGPIADHVLTELSLDTDTGVALTATSILRRRRPQD